MLYIYQVKLASRQSRRFCRSVKFVQLDMAVKTIPTIFFLGMCLVVATAQENLLSNPDFESGDFDGNWFCNYDECVLKSDTDAYSGNYSAYIINR